MKIQVRQLSQIWFDALIGSKPEQWSKISQGMLRMIYRRGLIRLLPQILRQIANFEHKNRGTTPVTIRSAHPLSQTTIHRALKSVLPKMQPIVTEIVDPHIIGGMQIETENRRFDFSLQSRLHALRDRLTRE